eukprot:TRINITY_DN7811_c0_g1_i1.p1 TRINITY_DN7811_c0_g1~~TRINITY_DN7811_c0_g1_i1.p1  ORF type:complete len:157 (+),score=24.93 TRINITY_DN7811_c0_g1_i1:199-669(+)
MIKMAESEPKLSKFFYQHFRETAKQHRTASRSASASSRQSASASSCCFSEASSSAGRPRSLPQVSSLWPVTGQATEVAPTSLTPVATQALPLQVSDPSPNATNVAAPSVTYMPAVSDIPAPSTRVASTAQAAASSMPPIAPQISPHSHECERREFI